MSKELPTVGAEQCETCRFGSAIEGAVLCRRYPPVLLRHTPILDAREAFGTGEKYGAYLSDPQNYDSKLSEAETSLMGWGFPTMTPCDWCGEYQPARVAPPPPGGA